MARIRQLKPEFWTDDKVARLSRDARLLFLGLWTEADDDGRLVDSTKLLAGSLFPFDDDVTPKRLGGWLEEIIKEGLVMRYARGSASYLYIVNFKRHQKIAHPRRSSLPPPEDDPSDDDNPPEGRAQNARGEPELRARDLGVKGSRGQGVEGSRDQGGPVVDPSLNHHGVARLDGKTEMDQPRDQPPPPPVPAELLERLLSVWPESRRRQLEPECIRVLGEVRRWIDDRIIDEAIGHMLGMSSPPATPRYLLRVAVDWAQQRGAMLSTEALASMAAMRAKPFSRGAA